MPNVTADKVLNHLMYANAKVNATDASGQKIIKSFNKNELIGKVFSYIENNGNLYWMFYLTPSDYNNFDAVYVKHETGKLDLPDLPNILQEIEDKKKADIIQKEGIFSYYIQKYLPYIVGAIVISIALPAITNSKRK
jgi:hypothetical protein